MWKLTFLLIFGVSEVVAVDAAMVVWVWGSRTTRTTFDILWSCLTVILVCTYKVIHLNIPSPKESSATWTQWNFWRVTVRKLKWMAIMALSPEVVMAVSIQDWLWAQQSVKKFRTISSQEQENTRDSSEDLEKGSRELSAQRLPLFKGWTKVQAHYADMGGYFIQFEQDFFPSTSSTDKRNLANDPLSFPVSADQLFELVSKFQLNVPFISEEDISDRSKADVFTKAFAVAQSAWLVIQCIARRADNLPMSQLELATLGFVGCAVVMYALWWDKPFDVQRPVTIECPLQYREEVLQMLREKFQARYTSNFLSPTWGKYMAMQRMPNWAYLDDLGLSRRTWFMSVLSIMGLGAAFSSLHIVAWNWEFPSLVEQTLWRVSSLAATAACVLVGALLPFMGTGGKWWQKWTVNIIVQPLWAMYMVARGVLLVQVVICMRRMPAGVYQDVNWTSYIPHAS